MQYYSVMEHVVNKLIIKKMYFIAYVHFVRALKIQLLYEKCPEWKASR
jgi:hypothetical protein